MKKNIIVILLVVFCQSFGCPSKKQFHYSNVMQCGDTIRASEDDSPKTWHLVVVSSEKCGFCLRAKKDIQKHNMPDMAKVTFLEYDLEPASLSGIASDSLYQNCEVVQANSCGDLRDFFPVFLLFKTETQDLAYAEEGWDTGTMEKLKSAMTSGK